VDDLQGRSKYPDPPLWHAAQVTPTTLRFTRIEDVMCLVHDDRNPAVEDWRLYVEALTAGVVDQGVARLLVVSRGGGPNAAQRKALVDSLGSHATKFATAVCSSSPIARGITTALGWLTPARITGFAYDDRRRALDFLAVPAARQAGVLIAVEASISSLAAARAAA
jgi:hypothetical protein